MSSIRDGLGTCCLLCACSTLAHADDGPGTLNGDKKALAPVQAYVGQWRGVGQTKRGSNAGAWTEESQWAWRFAGGRAELLGEISGDKYFAKLQLQPGEKPGELLLLATPVADVKAAASPAAQRFTGSFAKEALVLTAEQPKEDQPARISLRLVAGGDRLVVLYEKQSGENAYTRLAEVGSTRKGSSFAKAAASGPECVVTGGLGAIAVEHQGKKYFVCCGGCRDLFLEDPAGVLAEYRDRKAAERSELKK